MDRRRKCMMIFERVMCLNPVMFQDPNIHWYDGQHLLFSTLNFFANKNPEDSPRTVSWQSEMGSFFVTSTRTFKFHPIPAKLKLLQKLGRITKRLEKSND